MVVFVGILKPVEVVGVSKTEGKSQEAGKSD